MNMPSHTQISYTLLDRQSAEQVDDLQKFAQSFNHTVTTLRHQIIVAKNMDTDQKLGYFQIVRTPIVFPAMHPEFCKGRQVYDLFHGFAAWTKIEYGEGIMAVPFVTPFPPKVMAKLGFRRQNAEIYFVDNIKSKKE